LKGSIWWEVVEDMLVQTLSELVRKQKKGDKENAQWKLNTVPLSAYAAMLAGSWWGKREIKQLRWSAKVFATFVIGCLGLRKCTILQVCNAYGD
jgi:hypothetical protein